MTAQALPDTNSSSQQDEFGLDQEWQVSRTIITQRPVQENKDETSPVSCDSSTFWELMTKKVWMTPLPGRFHLLSVLFQ
jgi:hypothetical protein